jgi:hypothetical protein
MIRIARLQPDGTYSPNADVNHHQIRATLWCPVRAGEGHGEQEGEMALALRLALTGAYLVEFPLYLLPLQLTQFRCTFSLFSQELQLLFLLPYILQELLHAGCFYDIQLLPGDCVLSHSVF